MNRERLPAPPLALARADRQARSLRAALDRVALALAGAARSFVATRGWIDFGYARLDDHARERFSRSGRWLRDLAALAGAVAAATDMGADGPAEGAIDTGPATPGLTGSEGDDEDADHKGTAIPDGAGIHADHEDAGDEARTQVRLPVPAAVRAAGSTRLSSTRVRPTPTWVGLLALLDEFVATWDPPSGASSGRRSSEEEVYSRDGWRCAAPGCTSRRNLEDHHLVYRSRGGDNGHQNRTCLCRFHHQWGEHGSLARCRGRAPLGVDWILGRSGVGGRFRNERVAALSPTPTADPGRRPGPGGADCAL